MQLRELKTKDAQRMFEWMQDADVVGKMQDNFLEKTIEDCYSFIANSNKKDSIHMAIVNEQDLYMGTVSLKHITKDSAEFAIVIHPDAMGKGVSRLAMKEMIQIGLNKYKLKSIYWCVDNNNVRALRFYDKNGYQRVNSNQLTALEAYTEEQINSYIWYQVSI